MNRIKDAKFRRDVEYTTREEMEEMWEGERVFVINGSKEEIDRLFDAAMTNGNAEYEIMEFESRDEFRAFAQATLKTIETNLCELASQLYEQCGLATWDGIGKIAALRNEYLDNPITWHLVESLENKYGKEIGYCTELFDATGHRLIVTEEELGEESKRFAEAVSNSAKGSVIYNKYFPSMKMEIKK